MALNFFQGHDEIINNPEKKLLNNLLLFSNDDLKMYGQFSDIFASFGEHRETISEQEYNTLSEDLKTKDKQTYYILNGEPQKSAPIYLTVKDETLIILTNEVIQ